MRNFVWSLVVVMICTIHLPASALAHGPDGKGSAMFEAYERGEIDPRFKNRTNPVAGTAENVRQGIQLYQQYCVMCHGANATGDGHMAAMLKTKPADLQTMFKHFPDIDDYYFWVIHAGGEYYDIPMPSYEDVLSDDGIWMVITWMQAGFPGAGTEVKDEMHHDEHGSDGHMMHDDNHQHQMMGQ